MIDVESVEKIEGKSSCLFRRAMSRPEKSDTLCAGGRETTFFRKYLLAKFLLTRLYVVKFQRTSVVPLVWDIVLISIINGLKRSVKK